MQTIIASSFVGSSLLYVRTKISLSPLNLWLCIWRLMLQERPHI